MKRIAKFHKVSPEQFAKDWKDTFPAADDKEIQDTYEKISLPVRATAGSAGYDFFAPADIVLNPGETAKIPTGSPCGNGAGLGIEMLPEKWTGI